MKRDWTQNTFLTLTNPDQCGWNYDDLPSLTLNTIVLEINSKHLQSLLEKINPNQNPRLVENLEDLSHHMKTTVSLFQKLKPPDCIQMFVEGWVTSHGPFSFDKNQERAMIGMKLSV